MPYLPYSDLDEQKKKSDQNGQVDISGGSTTINQSSQNVAAPKPVQRSGSWTNLNAYLDANKDNAETMGNTISNNISNAGSDARTGIQNTQSDYNSLVDKGTLSNLGSAKSDSDSIVKQARTSAQDQQINDDQVNRFKDVSTAQYKGPNSLDASQYYTDAQSKLDKAKEYQTNAQSDSGRFNLLQEMFNRPTYSQGQKSLDNLLIQGNDTAKSGIKNAADSLSDLQSSWDKANTDAQSLATQRLNDTNDARQYAQNLLSTNRNERTNEVDSELANTQANWNNKYNYYNNLLSNYKGGDLNLSSDEARTLGLYRAPLGVPQGTTSKISPVPQEQLVSNIYNVLNGTPASTYLDQQAFDANKVVSKDEFAQLAALDRLANQYGLGSSSKYSDINQAGTLNLDNNFNATRFGDAAVQAGNTFRNAADNTSLTGHHAFDNFGFHVSGAADANIGQYLANPENISLSNYISGGGNGSGRDVSNQARYDSMMGAKSDLINQINQWLDEQGKNNLVKIK